MRIPPFLLQAFCLNSTSYHLATLTTLSRGCPLHVPASRIALRLDPKTRPAEFAQASWLNTGGPFRCPGLALRLEGGKKVDIQDLSQSLGWRREGAGEDGPYHCLVWLYVRREGAGEVGPYRCLVWLQEIREGAGEGGPYHCPVWLLERRGGGREQVRAAASTSLAGVLEGPAQRAFLSIAESLPSRPSPVRQAPSSPGDRTSPCVQNSLCLSKSLFEKLQGDRWSCLSRLDTKRTSERIGKRM